MLLLDALFALVIYKLFGEGALYVLGITCAVAFLRGWNKVTFVAGTYKNVIINKILEQEVQDHE